MASCNLTNRNAPPRSSDVHLLLGRQRVELQAARVDFATWRSESERRLRQADDLLAKARKRLHRIDSPHILKMPAR